ncbi:MAG: MetQ/NlpA family ABC transporter substrate-binding protein [Syntrophomonadaceae bacterium]|jgi:D-methionine transport system substrate-binding protein|nr:MetQ/NlpA family ABC transporter substrate-binding protein [Syntrophomonadaceae bacterium]
MKRLLVILCCLLMVGGLVAGCGSQNAADNSLVVGCTAKPHAEILEVVKPMLQEQGIELEIKVFTDYVLLNPALKDKQIDANFFQHIPYLEDYNTKNNADLVWIAKVHNEPMGVYSNKYDSVDKVPKGATVGIPNDATNGGRALMVLEAAGLLELKEGAGITATERDIVKNLLNLDIEMMDAAMLPRSLEDLDVCVINSNYALEAGLNPVEDSIAMEPKDSPFANVLVVRPEDKDNEAIKKLAAALQSEEVRQFLEETYQGSCVPAF